MRGHKSLQPFKGTFQRLGDWQHTTLQVAFASRLAGLAGESGEIYYEISDPGGALQGAH